MFSIQVIKLVIDNTALENYEKVYFANHPRAKKRPISQPYHESINKWMIMKRPQMNALKQRWKEFTAWFVQNSEYKDVHIAQCELKFITYYGTERRHDIDNGVPKFILDGLCESGFIIDDDSKHITSLTMQCFVDVDDPRTEIEVYVSKLLADYKRPESKEEKPMAKKKIKRISINAMEEIMKRNKNTETISWNGLELAITNTLGLHDMLAFVDGVVRSCFDSETGAYLPEAKDFAIRSSIVNYYTNISLPKNLEHRYDIVMMSELVDVILDSVNQQQFQSMMKAINAKLDHLAATNMQAINSQFAGIATSMEALQSKIAELFDGVSAEDISNLTGVLARGADLNERELVKAYIEQKQADA